MDTADTVLTRHKIDVDNYYRMAEAGILGEDDRVELIEGEIIDMAPIGIDHASTVARLYEALVLAFAGRVTITSQSPIRLDRFSEPEPDFAVLKRREDFYATARPSIDDVLLLIEVANTSLRYDRTVKLPLYARAGIPEVWIVDLQRRIVEAYRAPMSGQYAEATTYRDGDSLALALAPDITLRMSQVFG